MSELLSRLDSGWVDEWPEGKVARRWTLERHKAPLGLPKMDAVAVRTGRGSLTGGLTRKRTPCLSANNHSSMKSCFALLTLIAPKAGLESP